MFSSFTSILYLYFLGFLCQTAFATDYYERLLLKPLPEAAVLASFSFRSNTTVEAYEAQNFQHFPRSLGQILQHAQTKELHLRFSSGRWDDEVWGSRPRRGTREGGTGVELWAWVEAGSNEEANARWLTLTNALSGLFCASLNFVDETRTIRPELTFEPEGHHESDSSGRLHLLHGTLPGEVVCTENLTPILKLLPCKGKVGISSLFDGHKLFDSSWQAMAIDVRPVCNERAKSCFIEVEQTVDLVLDIERSKRPEDDPIPRPGPVADLSCDETKWYHQYGDACFPLPGPALPSFSIEQLFGRQLKGSCPLGGQTETICIDLSEGHKAFVNTTAKFTERSDGNGVTCYTLTEGAPFNLHVEESPNKPAKLSDSLPVLAERRLTGRGQETGGVEIVLTNPSLLPVSLIYLESLPWFMKPHMHTLTPSLALLTSPSTKHNPVIPPITQMIYRPSIDRQRGTHLELALAIPPSSRLTLTYAFEKAILRYAEYPPDANRGFNAPPAVVRILPGPGQQQSSFLRTTCLLLYLPTPDFSMPYNVIILTSTVIALGFGSIFNILVRRYVGADEVDALRGGGLRGRIRRAFGALREKIRGKGKTE